MGDPRIAQHRIAWQAKPALRAVYEDTYRRIGAVLVPGTVLEIGGGSGHLKRTLADVVATDVVAEPGLDAVADAHALPFGDARFANLVMVDVLHHLAAPRVFLAEACRVLRAGGRMVLVEPAVTPLSHVAFALFHSEPVDMTADPLEATVPPARRDPFAANQAIPTLLFGRDRARLLAAFPDLRLVAFRRLGLFAYPASGGYRAWSLLPGALVPTVLRLEDVLMPVLGPLMAFRLMVVLERR